MARARSPFFVDPLYSRMAEDLHLGGMSQRTHDGYLRAVRKLADFCRTAPDQITEAQLRSYFLHLKNQKNFAYGSLRVAYSGTKRSKTRTVSGTEFVRGFLQHTLPSGFQKVRYYGGMSPNSRLKLEEVKWLVWLYRGWTYWLASGWTYWLASGYAPQPSSPPRPEIRCGDCGGKMWLVGVYRHGALPDHAIAYLDSG